MGELWEWLAVGWMLGVAFIWFFAFSARLDNNGVDKQMAKDTARAILFAPVWPLTLTWLVVRWVPRAVGRLFFDATRRVEQ